MFKYNLPNFSVQTAQPKYFPLSYVYVPGLSPGAISICSVLPRVTQMWVPIYYLLYLVYMYSLRNYQIKGSLNLK